MEGTGGEWPVNALEQLEEDYADRVPFPSQAVAVGSFYFLNETFGPDF